MLLAIRFFEPLFGALIVVPFFGLPPWLLRFKLFALPVSMIVLSEVLGKNCRIAQSSTLGA